MHHRLVSVLLVVAVLALAAVLAPRLGALRLPGDQKGYEPVQPIAFSHRLHVGELEIDCQYCHWAAERSRHAGLPAASICMNCHRFVTAPMATIREEFASAKEQGREPRRIVVPEVAKLYRALALDSQGKPDPSLQPQAIRWVRVYSLPQFVYFDHRPHVLSGITCQSCHGPVERMERVRQVPNLSMGWCVNCHRTVNRTGVNGRPVQASTDCVTCHF